MISQHYVLSYSQYNTNILGNITQCKCLSCYHYTASRNYVIHISQNCSRLHNRIFAKPLLHSNTQRELGGGRANGTTQVSSCLHHDSLSEVWFSCRFYIRFLHVIQHKWCVNNSVIQPVCSGIQLLLFTVRSLLWGGLEGGWTRF